jgi:hypothetical protein
MTDPKSRGVVEVGRVIDLVRAQGALFRAIGEMRGPLEDLPGRAERCLATLDKRGIGLTPEQTEIIKDIFEPSERLGRALIGVRLCIKRLIGAADRVEVRIGDRREALRAFIEREK